MLLGLEAMLIGHEVDAVDEAVSADVLVTAAHLKGLVVLADLL